MTAREHGPPIPLFALALTTSSSVGPGENLTHPADLPPSARSPSARIYLYAPIRPSPQTSFVPADSRRFPPRASARFRFPLAPCETAPVAAKELPLCYTASPTGIPSPSRLIAPRSLSRILLPRPPFCAAPQPPPPFPLRDILARAATILSNLATGGTAPQMQRIALNFLPVTEDTFTLVLYSLPCNPDAPPSHPAAGAVRRTISVDSVSELHWTSFEPVPKALKLVLQPHDNVFATLDALRLALIRGCTSRLPTTRFRIHDGFRRHVEFVINEYPEGSQVISFEPYFLRTERIFGFLADFRFHPTQEYRGTRRALQLSLALDKNGQSNVNAYADRYALLAAFVNDILPSILPLSLPGGDEVSVGSQLFQVPQHRLEVKHYVVGTNRESPSQFMGVKKSGPFKRGPQDTLLYFLYRQEDRPMSHALFRALRGDTFGTFVGMQRMFGLPLSSHNVGGAPMADFSTAEIYRIRDLVISSAKGRPVVPIVLTPFSRHDDAEYNAPYWILKHAFLSRQLPLQVVSLPTVRDKNKLKWSTAGIGLQVFAKAGGTPWKVRPRTQRCLIVGIGQAHRLSDENRIERYFAYSVLADSSGVFEEVRVLGDSGDEEAYLQNFSLNLRTIIADYSRRFVNFVVHTPFSLRRREMESIANVFEERRAESDTTGEFVVLKFNDRNRFFGFAPDHNSRVPYESTVVRLSHNECLVWFEGLQYGHPVIREMVGGPLHVQFAYPRDRLTQNQQRAYLQDAINLSGANWRGFNAKSLPVSVYYAQLIARYLKEFEAHGLPAVQLGVFTPWFL